MDLKRREIYIFLLIFFDTTIIERIFFFCSVFILYLNMYLLRARYRTNRYCNEGKTFFFTSSEFNEEFLFFQRFLIFLWSWIKWPGIGLCHMQTTQFELRQLIIFFSKIILLIKKPTEHYYRVSYYFLHQVSWRSLFWHSLSHLTQWLYSFAITLFRLIRDLLI